MSGPRFIVGHGLQREGKGHDAAGRSTDAGLRGKCKCGLLSDPLPSVAARKRWHAVHKDTVLETRRNRARNEWNAANPVGTKVLYWPGERRGAGRLSKTRTPAWLLASGALVVSVEGYPGGISVTHVEPTRGLIA